MPLINSLYFRSRQFLMLNYPRLYNLCSRRKSMIKFFIAGGLAGATDLVFLFIFHGLLSWGIVISTSTAFILSFVVSFTLQKFWTFRNHRRDRMFGQFCLYLANAFIGLNLNAFFMHLLVNTYHVWYILAQIIVNLAIGAWNFLVYKFIIFRERQNEAHGQ